MIPRSPSLPRAFGKAQRGAYLIIMAVGMVVLIGFVGLAVDLSRQMIVHSKLQTMADACALAAVAELTGLPTPDDSVNRAKYWGTQFVALNLRSSTPFFSKIKNLKIDVGDATLVDKAAPGSSGDPLSHVRCELSASHNNFFIQILSETLASTTMTASAVATTKNSSSACLTPLMLRVTTPYSPPTDAVPYDDPSRSFGFSDANVAKTFGVMEDSVSGRYGTGNTQIGRTSGREGWCRVPFDETVVVKTKTLLDDDSAAANVAEGWCERFGGTFTKETSLNEESWELVESFSCNYAPTGYFVRRYTTVAVVDPAMKVIDSACVELSLPPRPAPTLTKYISELKLIHLGRHDRRCISQGMPTSAGARGPLVPVLAQ